MGDKPRRDLGSLIKRFREAPPTSPTRRHEDELRPRSTSPAPIANTNYSDIVRNLRKSKEPTSGGTNQKSASPATTYAGLGSLGGDDDFIAREIRQLKRDMHFNQKDRARDSLDSADGDFKGLAMPDLRFSQDFNVDTSKAKPKTRHDILANSGTYSPASSLHGIGGYRFASESLKDPRGSGDATLGNTGFRGLLMPDLMLDLDGKKAAKKESSADKGKNSDNSKDHYQFDDSKATDLGEYKLVSGDVVDRGDMKGINGALDGLLKHLHEQQQGIEDRLNAPPGSAAASGFSGASGGNKKPSYSTTSNFGDVNSIALIGMKLQSDLSGCFQHYSEKPEPEDKAEKDAREKELLEQGRREERERFLLSVTGLIPTPSNPGTGGSHHASSAGLGLSDSDGEDLHIIRTMNRPPAGTSRDASPANSDYKRLPRAGLHPHYDRPRSHSRHDDHSDDDSIDTLRSSVFGGGRKKREDPLEYHNPKDFRRPKTTYYGALHGGQVEQSDMASTHSGNYDHGTGFSSDVNPLEYGARRRFQTPKDLSKDMSNASIHDRMRARSRSQSPSAAGGVAAVGVGVQMPSHPGTPSVGSNHDLSMEDREPYRPLSMDSRPDFVPDIISTNSLTSTAKKIESNLNSAMDSLALRCPDKKDEKSKGKGGGGKGNKGGDCKTQEKGVKFADETDTKKDSPKEPLKDSVDDKDPLEGQGGKEKEKVNEKVKDRLKLDDTDKKRKDELDQLDKKLGPIDSSSTTRGIGDPIPVDYGKTLFEKSVNDKDRSPSKNKGGGGKPKVVSLEEAASQYLRDNQGAAASALKPVVSPVISNNYRFSQHPFTNSLTPDSVIPKAIDIDNSAIEAELGGVEVEPSAPPLPVGPRRALPSPGYMSPSSPMVGGVAGSGVDSDGSMLYNYSPSTVATATSPLTPFNKLSAPSPYTYPVNPATGNANKAVQESYDAPEQEGSEHPIPLGTSPSSMDYVYGSKRSDDSVNAEYMSQDPYPSSLAAQKQMQQQIFENYQLEQQLLMQSRDHGYGRSDSDYRPRHGASAAAPVSLSKGNIDQAHHLYANHKLPNNIKSAHISNKYGFDDLLVLPSSRKALEGQALSLLHSGTIDPAYSPPPHPSTLLDTNPSSSSSSLLNTSSELSPVHRNIYDVGTGSGTAGSGSVGLDAPSLQPESQYERERFLEHMKLKRASFARLLQ